MKTRAPIIASRIQPARFADVGKCPWCGISVTMRRDRPNTSCRDCTHLDKAFPRTQGAAELRTRADARDRQAADLRNQASEYARALALLDQFDGNRP